jgi:hypothetical protein
VITEASLHVWPRRLLETVQGSEVIRDGIRVVESGEVLLGKLLNGGNHLPKFLPFVGEMVLMARPMGVVAQASGISVGCS